MCSWVFPSSGWDTFIYFKLLLNNEWMTYDKRNDVAFSRCWLNWIFKTKKKLKSHHLHLILNLFVSQKKEITLNNFWKYFFLVVFVSQIMSQQTRNSISNTIFKLCLMVWFDWIHIDNYLNINVWQKCFMNLLSNCYS